MAGKASAWSIRRESAKHYLDAHKKYSLQAGQVLWAWNNLQREYQAFFGRMLHREDSHAPNAIWLAMASDQLQRDVLESAAIADLTANAMEKAALMRLRWALKETRHLAQYRNVAAHMPITIDYAETSSKTVPHWHSKKTAAALIETIGHKQLFESLIGELYVLSGYVGATRAVLYGISPGAFPRKPRLRLHRLCQAALSPPDQSKKTRRRGRRRSSRASPQSRK
jgi:hypothetical protein